jgi:hypothetical protein
LKVRAEGEVVTLEVGRDPKVCLVICEFNISAGTEYGRGDIDCSIMSSERIRGDYANAVFMSESAQPLRT